MNKKSLIIGILIGLLFGSMTVYAISVKSTNVTFTPDDPEWEITNVEDALNDLNNIANTKTNVYYLGTGTSFDIKSILPDIDYTKLTTSNFIIEPSGYGDALGTRDQSPDSYYSWGSRFYVNKSYNSSSGILTGYFRLEALSDVHNGAYGDLRATSNLNCKAYLILGNI